MSEFATTLTTYRGSAGGTVATQRWRTLIPGFEYPLIVATVELEEGTRLIANMTGLTPEQVEIGMPVELDWIDADPELTLPAFRPAAREEH